MAERQPERPPAPAPPPEWRVPPGPPRARMTDCRPHRGPEAWPLEPPAAGEPSRYGPSMYARLSLQRDNFLSWRNRPLMRRHAFDHLVQTHVREEDANVIAQRMPEVVSNTLALAQAADAGLPQAASHARLFLNCRQNFGHRDLRSGPTEPITASPTAYALHQPGAAQSQDDLL